MKVYPLHQLIFFQVAVGMIQDSRRSEEIIFVSYGETVILGCHTQLTNFNSSVWRRGEFTIFQGITLNPPLKIQNKYSIAQDKTKGENYSLKIKNITEEDLQSYWCETQTANGAMQTKITLVVRQFTTNRDLNRETSITTINDSEDEDSLHTTESNRESTTFPKGKQHTTDSTRNTDFTSTTEKVHTPDSDIGSKGVTGVDDKDSTFLSGMTINEKYVLFGMVGACFVLVLVLSISCNICINRKCKTSKINSPVDPDEPPKRQRRHRLSTFETASTYEYIDDQKLMCYTDPVNEIAPRLPIRVHKDTGSSVSSNPSYLEVVGETVDVYTYPYQSLSEMDNIETPHHYMEVIQPLAAGLVISSPEYEREHRRNSLDGHKNTTKNILVKRANSWPKGFRASQKLQFSVENSNDIFNQNNQSISTNKCESFDIKTNIQNENNIGVGRLAPFDQNVKDHSQTIIVANLNTERFQTKTKVNEPSIDDSTESFNKISNCSLDKIGQISISVDSSSDNDSEDKIISTKENGPYEDLSMNDLDDVHDYNRCSATLSLNIF